MKKLLLIFIILINIWPTSSQAFDNETTHKYLTEHAIAISNSINTRFLQDKLGMIDGSATFVNRRSLSDWLQYGAEAEDFGMIRSSNHFHNPVRDWNVSGVRDFIGTPHSNILWATNYSSPTEKSLTDNEWNWDKARGYYYAYLTATTKIERESNFSKSLQALGQVIHLLQDMAVPAHTRDDFRSHLQRFNVKSLNPIKKYHDYYEYWVMNNPGSVRSSSATNSGIKNQMVAKFWDTDIYKGQDPDTLYLFLLGLAEYTNMNFASKNTIFTEALPPTDVYYHPCPQ